MNSSSWFESGFARELGPSTSVPWDALFEREKTTVSGRHRIKVQWQTLAASRNLMARLPEAAGVYVISTRRPPAPTFQDWYVGKSKRNIRGRFRARFQVFREFNIPAHTVEQLLIPVKVHVGVIQPQKHRDFACGALEAYLMGVLHTLGRGNQQRDRVEFTRRAQIEFENLNWPWPRLPNRFTLNQNIPGARR